MNDENPPESGSRWRRILAPLRRIAPFALRYRGRIGLAVVALAAASLATLALPLAVRGMIDHGFSTDDPAAVNAYFGAIVGVVAILALDQIGRAHV